MSDSFCTELLQEMNDALQEPEEVEEENGVISNVQYEMIEGYRSGSKVLWAIEEQQLYYRNAFSTRTQLTGYTCRYANCTARIFVRSDNTAFRDPNKPHINQHGAQYTDFKQMFCESKMKERARNAPASMSPYDIYMEAVADWLKDPLCGGTPYPKVFSEFKKTLSTLRGQKYGHAPTNGEQILEHIEEENFDLKYSLILDDDGNLQRLLNDVVITDKFENIIFSSSKSIALMKEYTEEKDRYFVLDGTFQITPKGVWQQILILQANFGLKSFPLAYILMSKRTTEAYESAFNYVHENLIPFHGDAIIIDFEKGMRTGLKKVLHKINSKMQVLGCWFHFCQSLRRKMTQLQSLNAKVKTDDRYYNIFRRFQCLALLPVQHIESSFRNLSKEAIKLDLEAFQPFVNYFYNEWIKIVTPQHFCVYLRGKRTTADAESFNMRINKLFRTHSNFFHFCEVLQKLEASTSNQLQNYVDGVQQKDTRSSFYKKRSVLIHKLMIEHKDNPKLLLNALANIKNKILYGDTEITVDIVDVEMTKDAEVYGNEDEIVYNEVLDYDNFDINLLSRSRCSSPSSMNENDEGICSPAESMSDLASNANDGAVAANTVVQRNTASRKRGRANQNVQTTNETRSRTNKSKKNVPSVSRVVTRSARTRASPEIDEGICSPAESMSDLASNTNDEAVAANTVVSKNTAPRKRGQANQHVQKTNETRSRANGSKAVPAN